MRQCAALRVVECEYHNLGRNETSCVVTLCAAHDRRILSPHFPIHESTLVIGNDRCGRQMSFIRLRSDFSGHCISIFVACLFGSAIPMIMIRLILRSYPMPVSAEHELSIVVTLVSARTGGIIGVILCSSQVLPR